MHSGKGCQKGTAVMIEGIYPYPEYNFITNTNKNP